MSCLSGVVDGEGIGNLNHGTSWHVSTIDNIAVTKARGSHIPLKRMRVANGCVQDQQGAIQSDQFLGFNFPSIAETMLTRIRNINLFFPSSPSTTIVKTPCSPGAVRSSTVSPFHPR